MTIVTIELSEELNDALDYHVLTLKRAGVRTTKESLIVRLMRIGLLKESTALINEGRTEI
jgi:hypothetical protein